MLIQITNTCFMGCGHCMQDSTPEPMHMSDENINKAFDLAKRLGCRFVMISGGEPTEHPKYKEILEKFCKEFYVVSLITNGMWLGTPKEDEIRELVKKYNLFIQVTSIPGIYKDCARIQARAKRFPNVSLTTDGISMLRLGRARTDKRFVRMAEQHPYVMSCFSSSLTSAQLGFSGTIQSLEMRLKPCHPLVTWKGGLSWSESCLCPAFATLDDTFEDICRKAKEWRPCGGCPEYRKLQAKKDIQYLKAKNILGIKSTS